MTLMKLSLIGVGLGALAMSEAAFAQSAAEPDDGAERGGNEIIVTAQKREQDLGDVAVSISAVSGDLLEKYAVTNAIEIVNIVPGVEVSGAGGGTNNSFSIRGVTQNAFASNLESPVAVYFDESYITLNNIINSSTFDIERVEVLRGPQSTLFGRNATGGLIRYLSARPTDTAEGFLNLRIGTDTRIRAEGAYGGPVSDSLSVRLSGVFNYNDGLIENDIGPDAYQVEDYAVRGQLLFKPTEDFSAWIKVQYANQDDARGGYAHVAARAGEYVPRGTPDFFGYEDADGDPFTGSFDFPFFSTAEVIDLTGVLEYSFGDVTLTSVTNYQDIDTSYGEDSDVSPNSVYHFIKDNFVEQFSQELRLNYSTDGFDLVVGAFYLKIDGIYSTDQTGDVFFGGGTETAFADQQTTAYAVFTQADIDLTDKLSLSLGLRYNKNEVDYLYSTTNLFDAGGLGAFDVSDSISEDDISGRLVLNYKPNDDMLVYAGYNRGTKAGGFNFPLFAFGFTNVDDFIEGQRFRDETLNAYEVGLKTDIGPFTTLNMSAFYYDYKDFQAFTFDGLATRILNVDGENYGGEIEIFSSPVDGLDLVFGAAFLDATVTGVPRVVSPTGRETPVFSPSVALNGLVSYTFDAPFKSGGSFNAQVDGNWQSDYNFNLTATPVLVEPGFAIFNARFAYTNEAGDLELAVFVKNLTNNYYRAYSFDTSPDFGALEDVPGIPRWVGASVNIKF
jgi:iron complex outermembrane receptor protein